MAYGDGGFFFLQPVGNGYSGTAAFGAPNTLDPNAMRVNILRQQVSGYKMRLAQVLRSPTRNPQIVGALQKKIAQTERALASLQRAASGSRVPDAIRTVSRPSTSGTFTYRQVQPEMSTEVMPEVAPEALLWQDGPMVTVPGGVDLQLMGDDEMVEVSTDMGPEPFLDRAMGFVQERPLVSALAAAVAGYAGYRGYRYYRNRKG